MTKMMNKEDLKSFASQNICYVLDKLGISYIERGNLYQGCCICKHHAGDGNNPTAFCWSETIQTWCCFTHGCQDKYGSDIIGLVRSILDISYKDAIQWLHDILTSNKAYIHIPNVQRPRINNLPLVYRPLPENFIRFLDLNPHPYMIKRGFKTETINQYEVGFWHRPGTIMNDCIVIPIRDINNHLVGFSGRTIHPEIKWAKLGIKSKWIHSRYFDRFSHPNEFQKTSIVYNLNNVKHDKSLIVVEGPLDGFRLTEANIHNWVALLGTDLSPIQRTLLIRSNVNHLRLWLDPDEAGVRASEKIKFQTQDFFNVDIIKTNKEPGDMSVEELREYYNAN